MTEEESTAKQIANALVGIDYELSRIAGALELLAFCTFPLDGKARVRAIRTANVGD